MKLIRLPTVMGSTGYGKSMIYKLIKEDQFPKPVQLGARAVAWVDEEVQAWIHKRIAASRPKPAHERASEEIVNPRPSRRSIARRR